eukprot:scaffold62116_cov45-Attheya_sp.AAC.1
MMRISRMIGCRRRIGVPVHPPSRRVSCDVLWSTRRGQPILQAGYFSTTCGILTRKTPTKRSYGTTPTRPVRVQTRQKTDDATARTVRIGTVERKINPKPPASPHLIPVGYLPSEPPSQSVLSHLQWIMSKVRSSLCNVAVASAS